MLTTIGIVRHLFAQLEWSHNLPCNLDRTIRDLGVVLSNRSCRNLAIRREPEISHALIRAWRHSDVLEFDEDDDDSMDPLGSRQMYCSCIAYLRVPRSGFLLDAPVLMAIIDVGCS